MQKRNLAFRAIIGNGQGPIEAATPLIAAMRKDTDWLTDLFLKSGAPTRAVLVSPRASVRRSEPRSPPVSAPNGYGSVGAKSTRVEAIDE